MTARCTLCGVRDHAFGGRSRTGEFLLALPIEAGDGRPAWPRLGSLGWCGVPEGEVQRLTIAWIKLTAGVCQHCRPPCQAGQAVLPDLFTFPAATPVT